jgi:uncharacterized protein (TIGR03067 family)
VSFGDKATEGVLKAMLTSKRNILVVLACTSAFLLTAAEKPSAAEKNDNSQSDAGPKKITDKDRLQGRWQLLSIAIEDKIIKREGVPREWKGTFEKDLFVDGDRFGQVGYSNAKIKLDESRDPKQITVQNDDGKVNFRGIYSLDGDRLKVCMNGDGSDVRRPEEFATKKGTPLLLIVLKRAPADK